MDPLLRENRIEESPAVLRNLDLLVAPPPVQSREGIRQPDLSATYESWRQPEVTLIIDHDLLLD